jgi:hypothetical protein
MLLRVSDDRLSNYKGCLDDFRKKKVEVPSNNNTSARQLGRQRENVARVEKDTEEEGENEATE